MSKIGFITIGQSPRVDLHKDITNILRDDIEIVEVGILDNYNYEEASKKFSPDENDVVFVSRMRDARQVKMGREKIIPLIQEAINNLDDDNVDIIVLLCTGVFPDFYSKSIFIEPQRLVHSVIKELSINKKVGIILPDNDQVEFSNKTWDIPNIDYSLNVLSPYLEGSFNKLYSELTKDEVDIVYMDCIGYSIEMKNKIKNKINKPVIIPRTIIAHILNELV